MIGIDEISWKLMNHKFLSSAEGKSEMVNHFLRESSQNVQNSDLKIA
jgi:hypothetical protein